MNPFFQKNSYICERFLKPLSVAQLVEQLTLNQRVAGSNPSRETQIICKVFVTI